MNKEHKGIVDEGSLLIIDYVMEELKVEGPKERAKLYRKIGLDLVAIAAQINAELIFGP